MVRPILLLLTAWFWLTLFACQNRRQAPAQPKTNDTTTAAAPNPAADSVPPPITGRLAALGLTPDSHWRGVTLGDDFATVKQHEPGPPFEQDARHVGYTLEFKNLESADVLYDQTGGKVSAIRVDLYLNNQQSVSDYERELSAYFTRRYGTPRPGNGGTLWNGPAGEQVTLRDVSKGKDFGLKIRISPQNNRTAASAK